MVGFVLMDGFFDGTGQSSVFRVQAFAVPMQ